MPTPTGPSSVPSPTPQERAVREVLTRFDVYARIRAARAGVLSSSRVGPREEERAFDELQQAVVDLRALIGAR
ncbi:hypothetical protein ACIPSE_43710 [Streptomyces sp. NPDC090106]|uniref:hypothetical protein n=1 Tax=Streptomyces sp. NPDC090106 TaxID=3365946 RepID=UPI00382EDA1E